MDKQYKCNDCEEGEQFVGTCKLSLPRIAAKPRYCPIFDGSEDCNWVEVLQPKESLEWGETIQ